VQVHLNAPALALALDSSGWFVQTPAGQQGPFAAVVLNAPPMVAARWCAPLPWAATLPASWTSTSTSIRHPDPHRCGYVHPTAHSGPPTTAVSTVASAGERLAGAIPREATHRRTVDVFKSWAQHRRADPTNILLDPLISRDVIRAARALRPMQGRNVLYMSGQYTTAWICRSRLCTRR